MKTITARALLKAFLVGSALALRAVAAAAGPSPPDGLVVTASVDYPERHSVPGDLAGYGSVHAVGVPRGGAFDVIVDGDLGIAG
jgi:hypothetical protein